MNSWRIKELHYVHWKRVRLSNSLINVELNGIAHVRYGSHMVAVLICYISYDHGLVGIIMCIVVVSFYDMMYGICEILLYEVNKILYKVL